MTKAEFCNLPELIREVKRRREEIETLEAMAEGASFAAENERVQSSAKDRTELLAIIIDLKAALEPQEEYLTNAIEQAKKIINNTLRGRDQRLMRLRYLTGLKWHQIAGAMHYNQNYIQELNASLLERIFPEKTKTSDTI